jgi:hypothetical protein
MTKTDLGNCAAAVLPEAYTGPSVFHVGYIKTGTTYLQNEVFSSARLGMALGGGSASRSYLVDWFTLSDEYVFDPSVVEECLAELENDARRKGQIPVWSDETLIGNPLTRTYLGPSLLRRLSSLSKPIKVIITIREQCAFCLSAYREFIKHGGVHDLESFIGTGNEPRSYTPILRPEFLHFDRAAQQWISAFGIENVLIQPFELLTTDRARYLTRLVEFLGVDFDGHVPDTKHNVGIGGTALSFKRVLNRLYVRSPLSQERSMTERVVSKATRIIDRLTPEFIDRRNEDRLRAAIENRFRDEFGESNRRLEKLVGLNLKSYGYQ